MAIVVVGMAYLSVIAVWLIVERQPREPIGDPYLATMEVLTIVSALALLALLVGLLASASESARPMAMMALVVGTLAAGVTMTVHFVQLTAVRQLWRAGQLADYRLVWPSTLFAAEYLAWDVLVGLSMVSAGLAMREANRRRARGTLVLGGAFCMMGVVGPATGHMLFQNVSVFGYAVLLPVAAAFVAADTRRGTGRQADRTKTSRQAVRERSPAPKEESQ